MIKTTITLTCDRCGREIKAGDRYYVEEVNLFHRIWNGTEEVMIPGEDPEGRERDLCEECRADLYEPKGTLAEEPQAAELPSTPPKEPSVVAEDVATGETVELEGKTYTEYQPEPGMPELAPGAKEAAEQIVAMGEKAEKKPKKRLTDAQKEQIVRMMQDGTTMDRVAKTVGCSPQTVCNVWHKYNTNQEVQDGRQTGSSQ